MLQTQCRSSLCLQLTTTARMRPYPSFPYPLFFVGLRVLTWGRIACTIVKSTLLMKIIERFYIDHYDLLKLHSAICILSEFSVYQSQAMINSHDKHAICHVTYIRASVCRIMVCGSECIRWCSVFQLLTIFFFPSNDWKCHCSFHSFKIPSSSQVLTKSVMHAEETRPIWASGTH